MSPKKKIIPKAKKETTKDYIHCHKDGNIFAKGKMIGNVPDGYWEWFRKSATIKISCDFLYQ